MTTTASTDGEAAAAATATESIGRSPIDRNGFGISEPSRRPAPAARMIATARVSWLMRGACQRRPPPRYAEIDAVVWRTSGKLAKIMRPVAVWMTLRTRAST